MFFKLKLKLNKVEVIHYLKSVSKSDSLLLIIPIFGFFRKNKKSINPDTDYLGTVYNSYFQLRRLGINKLGETEALGFGVSGFMSEYMNRVQITFWFRPIFELSLYLLAFIVISSFALTKLIPNIFDSKQQIFSLIIVLLFLSLWGWVLWNYYKLYKIEKAYWSNVFADVLDESLS